MQLMCVDDFKKNLCHYCNTYMSEEPCEPSECWVHDVIAQTEIVPAIVLPCKVGDEVWCVRDTRVYSKPVKGVVSEIYFRDNMDMCIVVRRLCRGRWGERVFATEQEAQAAIDRQREANG